MASVPYIGRFAPSPSGPLHAGSVVAAMASWLDARAHDGRWLLRIEDIDPPRVEPGSDIRIRQQLRFLGLHWDAPPWYQSARVDRYQAAFEQLTRDGRIYGCACTRKEIAQAWAAHRHSVQPPLHLAKPAPESCPAGTRRNTAAMPGATDNAKPFSSTLQACVCWPLQTDAPAAALRDPSSIRANSFSGSSPAPQTHEETPYLGTCRHGIADGKAARAWRFRTDGGVVHFHDRWLGPQHQTPRTDCGDFVLKRADGVWAYQLAVVVDDIEAGITDIVRGADLLSSTGRQMQLQHALGAPAPRYMHLPLIMGENGQKLSKQNGAPAIDDSGRVEPVDILNDAARALGLRQPDTRDPQRWLHAATAQWRERFTAAPDSAAR